MLIGAAVFPSSSEEGLREVIWLIFITARIKKNYGENYVKASPSLNGCFGQS
jgi:hypothetical protein